MEKATLGQARKVLDLIADKQVSEEQLQELLETGLLADLLEAKAKAVNREEFRWAIGLKPADVFLVAVDYDRSVENGVKAGCYDRSNPNITSDHFPSDKKGKTEVMARPIGFNRSIGSDEAIAKLDEMGYRPADLQETLAYGEKRPEEQLKGPIVGLGSRWRDPLGLVSVPVLSRLGSKRRLSLYCFAHDWHEHFRFLAVRKHQSR